MFKFVDKIKKRIYSQIHKNKSPEYVLQKHTGNGILVKIKFLHFPSGKAEDNVSGFVKMFARAVCTASNNNGNDNLTILNLDDYFRQIKDTVPELEDIGSDPLFSVHPVKSGPPETDYDTSNRVKKSENILAKPKNRKRKVRHILPTKELEEHFKKWLH